MQDNRQLVKLIGFSFNQNHFLFANFLFQIFGSFLVYAIYLVPLYHQNNAQILNWGGQFREALIKKDAHSNVIFPIAFQRTPSVKRMLRAHSFCQLNKYEVCWPIYNLHLNIMVLKSTTVVKSRQQLQIHQEPNIYVLWSFSWRLSPKFCITNLSIRQHHKSKNAR